jgi:hypothetical protein
MPKFDIRKRAPKTIKTKARKFDRIACLSLQPFYANIRHEKFPIKNIRRIKWWRTGSQCREVVSCEDLAEGWGTTAWG